MHSFDLGINIDHVATLRQARGVGYPDPIKAALWAEEAGADVITLHLREDRRHIQDADLFALRPLLKTRMNLECAVTPEMLAIACKVAPQDVCLVPEKRQEVTTEGGLDVMGKFDVVQAAVQQLQGQGIRVSLFIDPTRAALQASADAGAGVVELHTGQYALADNAAAQQRELKRIAEAAEFGASLGLKINAGHGLHYSNTQAMCGIAQISELNIGHAIVAHAVFVGWKNAVIEMKALMQHARAQSIK